ELSGQGAGGIEGLGRRAGASTEGGVSQLSARVAGERRVPVCGLRTDMRSKFSSFDPTRREIIRSMVCGSSLLPAIVQQCLADAGDDLAPRAPHFPPKAKRVIFMLASGGASHIDTFDPKPALMAAAKDGKKAPNGKPWLG